MLARRRADWIGWLAAIIVAGIASRVVHTGWAIFDKYLGDALYAAMVYVMMRIAWQRAAVAVPAMTVMTALELFQLTLIPAKMLTSTNVLLRICARLLGTEFSLLDLLAYAVGIGFVYWVDDRRGVAGRF